MATIREFAVKQGRAMVRVRSLKTRDPATAGFCPACFNLKERRIVLLLQLEKMGYEVVHRQDRPDGVFRSGKSHAPGCRYAHLPPDAWSAFAQALKGTKKT